MIEASDGPTALATIERQLVLPDVLVSDVVMPGGMSGIDLVNNVTRVRPAVKAILMSGHPHGGPVRDEIRLPNTAFIAKPFGIEALAQKIREVLQEGTDSPICR